MTKHLRLLTFALAVAAVQPALAVILNVGVLTPLPGTISPGGTVLADVDKDFAFAAYGGTVTGHVQNRVVRKGDGTLFFAWRIFNDPNSSGAIQSFRLGQFMTSVYDGDSDPSSPVGSVPSTNAFNFGGGFVNFNFQGVTGAPSALVAGTASEFVYLNTDATEYGEVAIYDLANIGHTEISDTFSTFAPVPEPASLCVLVLGALVLKRRR